MGKKLKAFLLIRVMTQVSTLSTLTQYSAWIISRVVSQDKEIKRIQIGKEKVKLFQFVHDISYI
jgi:hypothetical protein